MERSRTSFTWEPSDFSSEIDGDSRTVESIDELARRVLFSENLEEKLKAIPLSTEPEGIVVSASREKLKGIIPARAQHLTFARPGAARPSLPTRPALVTEESRGVLLHFFANHELLAAELMALALLKFPDAPEAFRRGLAETLREEQRHTRWYLARMRECGLEFGTYPLSPYFWEAVSPMESPLDYVSRLSLTFEQANLDYASYYSKVLSEVGDRKSASILRQIYKDEISHVGYGLNWFRQWKAEGQSDWDALQNQLPFPLSPSRAKGNRTGFNIEGRRAAGFDEDYIRRLELFERSKGRTPNVFYFNPEAEHRAARWPRPFHPDRQREAVIRDLELLAAYLARKDDVLLVRRLPSEAHRAKLAAAGLGLPELEELAKDGSLNPTGLLQDRKIHRIQPWAIAPDLSKLFAPLSPTAPLPGVQEPFSDAFRQLFSKLGQSRELTQWMSPSIACLDHEEIAQALTTISKEGYSSFLLKRAFSTAGSGLQKITQADLLRLQGRPLHPTILEEGGILVEPYHERVFDFSVQYHLDKGSLRCLGFVEQIVTASGGYRGSRCRIKFCKDLAPELARFIVNECFPLYAEEGELASDLARWAAKHGYEGPLGVDAYLFRDPEGALALRAICEVNPRYTMGRVALELRRRVSPGRDLQLSILKASDLQASDDEAEVDSAGRLCRGSVILTEPLAGSIFAATCSIL